MIVDFVVVEVEGVERAKVGSGSGSRLGGVDVVVGIGRVKADLWRSKYGRRNKGHGRAKSGCYGVTEVPRNDVDDEECEMAF